MNNSRRKENWKQLVHKGGRECDNFTSFLSPSPVAFCARRQSLNGTITKSFKGHWVELQVLGVSPNSYDGLSYIYFFTGRRERFILTKFTKKKNFLVLSFVNQPFHFTFHFSLRSSGASREADV